MADVNFKIDVWGNEPVVIYLRMNRDGSVNKVFQMRIRIPLSALKGYFRVSTGESNQGSASQVALNKSDELYNKVKGGGTLLGKSFKDLLNGWKVHYPKPNNDHLPQYIECSINRIGNYPYKFFVDERGNPKVNTITSQDFSDEGYVQD